MEMKTQPLRLWPVLVLAGSFLAGSFTGCLFGGDGDEIGSFLRDFIGLVRTDSVNWTVWEVLWQQGRWFLLCFLLGSSPFGAVGIPVVFGLRGFLLSFGVSCFVREFGPAGLLPAVCLFGVCALLWGPGLFGLGSVALRRAVFLARRKGGEEDGGRGRRFRLFSILSPMLCVMYECGALPVLLPLAVRILE